MLEEDKDESGATEWITLSEVWLAYRKAKLEAFYDRNCAYGIKFARFEENLASNLSSLHRMLQDSNDHSWSTDVKIIGRAAKVPKKLNLDEAKVEANHFSESDPTEEWKRQYTSTRRAGAELRTVIDATVEILIISTLWVLKVGEKFDSRLDDAHVYGNRLRRRFRTINGKRSINWKSHSLFKLYVGQYSNWRKDGIEATKESLQEDGEVLAITLDVTSFYDKIDPAFLISEKFLDDIEVSLTEHERSFTNALIKAMEVWRVENGLDGKRGVPVGLPSSALIANSLLFAFDRSVRKLNPVFYGRYVDDIYLCVKPRRKFKDSRQVYEWLSKRLPNVEYEHNQLHLRVPYSANSEILFGHGKQRVFMLKGKSGLDLIQPIEEHMRKQSSEHRLLPELPESEAELAEMALLVSRDATLRAALIRDADLVTLQRAGLSNMLRSFERTEELLHSSEWKSQREAFYSLVHRHILAPVGFFEHYIYIPRIVGLMCSCGDWVELGAFLRSIRALKKLLLRTTNLKPSDWDLLFSNLAKRIELSMLKVAAQLTEEEIALLVAAMARIRVFGDLDSRRIGAAHVRKSAWRLLLADWSRRPFFDHHFSNRVRVGGYVPRLPAQISKALALKDIELALKVMPRVKPLSSSSWRGFVFPTRSIPLGEITCRLGWRACVGAGKSGRSSGRRFFYRTVLALKGYRLPSWALPSASRSMTGRKVGINIGTVRPKVVRVAVSSLLTPYSDFKNALNGTPTSSYERFKNLILLLNQILRLQSRPDFVVLPEVSLPRRYELLFSNVLAASGISLVAGLEYEAVVGSKKLRKNEALVSLKLPYYGSYRFFFPKNHPAWDEEKELSAKGLSLEPIPAGQYPSLPVINAQGLRFGILICSDLTNPKFRAAYQGEIDALFVLEWNKDVNGFASLVEASALDIHCFVVQANNRLYGDSRIRGPLKKSYLRDIVQLKGGIDDFFVTGEIDPVALREFQAVSPPDSSKKAEFKPYPVGFQINDKRMP